MLFDLGKTFNIGIWLFDIINFYTLTHVELLLIGHVWGYVYALCYAVIFHINLEDSIIVPICCGGVNT